eukprot:500868_1
MSSSQIYINDHEEKLELLLCGYTKNILQSSIPNVVVQLIMLFYHHNLKRLFAIDTTQFTTRYDVFEHFRKSRHATQKAKYAGAWKRAKPIKGTMRFNADQYKTASGISYGWELFDFNYDDRYCKDCGEELDLCGTHCINCGTKDGLYTITHNKIRDIYFEKFKRGGFNVEKEKPGLLESGRKPADIYGYEFIHGLDYAFDITLTSPFKKNTLADTIKFIGISAEKAIRMKYKKYKDDIKNVHWKFQPIAFERTGGFSLPAQLLTKRIALQLAAKYNINYHIVLNSIVTEISSILLKEAAQLVIRRKADIGPDWYE